jgi:GT2 family glycosyltransferase
MKPSAKPLVSVVIPVYNGIRFTLECLGAINAFTKIPHEVIVCGTGVDGTVGSMREMEEKYANFKFVHNDTEHTHFAANVNMGAKHAAGDFICLLNNDTIVTPRWLEKMLQVFHRLSMLEDRKRPCPPPAIIGPVSN